MSGLRLWCVICSVWTSRSRIRAHLIAGCLGALPCRCKQTDDYTCTYQQYKRQQTLQLFPYREDQYHHLLKPESNMFSRPIPHALNASRKWVKRQFPRCSVGALVSSRLSSMGSYFARLYLSLKNFAKCPSFRNGSICSENSG